MSLIVSPFAKQDEVGSLNETESPSQKPMVRGPLIAVAALLGLIGLMAFVQGEPEPETYVVDGEVHAVIKRPLKFTPDHGTQLLVKLPEYFVDRTKGRGLEQFKSENFESGNLYSGVDKKQRNLISYDVRTRPDGYDGPWTKYENIASGGSQFGLDYRPLTFGDRPDFLLKRAYLKPGVPGKEFYISCIPGIGPNSIAPPKRCVMEVFLTPTIVSGRVIGVEATANFPIELLSEWRLIEQRLLVRFQNRVEVLGPD